MKYRKDIDGLRAISVLLVLIFHFNLFEVGDAGFIGVDIFFVISGYLISSIMWSQLDRSQFSLKNFYARRIRRLAPALVTVQILSLIAGFIWLMPSEAYSLAKESFFTQTYLSNIYYFRTLDYFGLNASSAFMLHTWYLAVEEQYYLIYPIFLILIHRYARHSAFGWIALVTVSSFALNILLVGNKPWAAFYLLPTRAWEMGLGALIPSVQGRFAVSASLRHWAGIAAPFPIMAALFIYREGMAVPGWFALLPTGAGMLFILAGTAEGSAMSRLLGNRLGVWIGRISYPLYLVHWPLHIFGLTLLSYYDLTTRWALLGLCFLIAWLIYRLVERPIQNRQWFKRSTHIFGAYAMGLIVMGLIIGSALQTGGWRGRFDAPVLNLADAARDVDESRPAADFGKLAKGSDPFQRIGSTTAKPHWLIFGDSHAGALTAAADRWLKRRGEAGYVGFQSNCAPITHAGDPVCRAFVSSLLARLQRDSTVGNVLILSIWYEPLNVGFMDDHDRHLSGAAAISQFRSGLHDMLSQLHALGLRTYIWEPVPVMPSRVPVTAARNAAFGTNRPTAITLADHRSKFKFLRDELDASPSLVAGRVDPAATLCPAGRCSAVIGRTILYSDDSHPAYSQTPLFADILEKGMIAVPRAGSRSVAERPIP